jgi:hypothetical protein
VAAGPVSRRGCFYAILEETSSHFTLGQAGVPPLSSPLSPFCLVEPRRVTLAHVIMGMVGRNRPEKEGRKHRTRDGLGLLLQGIADRGGRKKVGVVLLIWRCFGCLLGLSPDRTIGGNCGRPSEGRNGPWAEYSGIGRNCMLQPLLASSRRPQVPGGHLWIKVRIGAPRSEVVGCYERKIAEETLPRIVFLCRSLRAVAKRYVLYERKD